MAFFRKVETPGTAPCLVCNETIKYGKKVSFACKSVKHGKNKNIFTTEWLDIHVVFQQVTSMRDSSQYTSNLYKKMGAFCALISVINGLESISEHLDP